MSSTEAHPVQVAGKWTKALFLSKNSITPPLQPCRRRLAFAPSANYARSVVKQPFVNVEEEIDRFVGRRTKTPDALSLAGSTKANAIA